MMSIRKMKAMLAALRHLHTKCSSNPANNNPEILQSAVECRDRGSALDVLEPLDQHDIQQNSHVADKNLD